MINESKEAHVQVLFNITAQVAGFEHQVTAEHDGSGIVLRTPTGTRTARTISDACRIAGQDLSLYLKSAKRPGVPWGLHVSVGGVAAVYGEWPLLQVPADDTRRRREPSPVTRIRSRWHDGDGPMAALDNALRIIEAYTGRRAAA